MSGVYELIKNHEGLPIKAFIHSVGETELHWHHDLEILLVLKGKIDLRAGESLYNLGEGDIYLINCNEIHSISKSEEDTILLVLQIDIEHYSRYYPRYNNIRFKCNSATAKDEEEEKYNTVRHYMAQIIKIFNKKVKGYELMIGSEVNLLGSYLLNNFEYYFITDEDLEQDILRVQSILSYINNNLERKITLQEIADREHLSPYYLSHFFKEKVGISFQEYLKVTRLYKSTRFLLNTNKTITEISNESGFSSTNYFNQVFKEKYNCTPTEYRGNNKKVDKLMMEKSFRSRTYLDVDRRAAFGKLFTYIKPELITTKDTYLIGSTKEKIEIDLEKNKPIPYKAHWRKLTTFGRAAEGLRGSWQNQLKELQEDIKFEYIRFHGIFSDDMMICDKDDKGNIVYNWSYVDELLDYFKKVNIKPFIELGYMPEELASFNNTTFWWKANISRPKEIQLWLDLVREFIIHCINRYGIEEVKTWYFEVWNEPDLEYVFWIGSREDYFEFYKETVLEIKSISKELIVGGPAITIEPKKLDNWIEDFLIYCNTNKIPLDFLSLHIYPESFSNEESLEQSRIKAETWNDFEKDYIKWMDNNRVYHNENHTIDTSDHIHSIIDKYLTHKPELHITEWNASASSRNFINDTAFVATYIVKNNLDSIGKTNSLGYWTFTDMMEEFKVDRKEFHGGFGLITKNGLKKPSYYAYYLLSKLGEDIIQKGEDYIVTKSQEGIQILLYNFTYFDNMFLKGDISMLTEKERYEIYNPKAEREIDIYIRNISGRYKITRYELNKDNGSSFDEWLKIGAPINMSKEEINYIKRKTYPKISTNTIDIDIEYKEKSYIPVHGIELINLKKIKR